MDRRSFIRAGVVGGVAAATVSNIAKADHVATKSFGAGALYYTKENPGRWAKKVAGHAPLVDAKKAGNKAEVMITTPHEMRGYEHYIVKHTLLDENMHVLSEKVFDPTKDKSPISKHTIEGYSGKLYAISVCNLHDAWVTEATV